MVCEQENKIQTFELPALNAQAILLVDAITDIYFVQVGEWNQLKEDERRLALARGVPETPII